MFYPLVADNDEVKERLHDHLRRAFWSGDMESRHIGRFLYKQIPIDESLRLKSFTYSSPGAVDLAGVLGCLWMLSRVARGWRRAGSEFIDLWAKVRKFFAKRKTLRRPQRRIAVNEELAITVDEARALCFEIGEKLGFDAISCDTLVTIIGNPMAALKYLVAAGLEGRKLSELQKANLLRLPEPSEATTTIPAPGRGARRRTGSVVVETKRSRAKKADHPKAT